MRARGLARVAPQRKLVMKRALLPLTMPHLTERTDDVWRLIGDGALAAAREVLRKIEGQLKALPQ
ncbi:hypothetical protein ABIA00_006974 [Bradyrhizobium ottawaense]|uniref:Uncharacterized protein n=1 Tax=Bradyrhizobium ottawaense TaxID=931866 RepID=A0A2U8PIX0_9BRAD|nr:hypothetical protein CIT37_40360 [Bradyrhizobium ottawaense]BBO14276.1 hypothetical protein TM102_57460 [Bradyrhizobium sp. TM102]